MVVSPPRGMPGTNGNGGRQAPPFDRSTRYTLVKQAPITRPVSGGLSPDYQIPSNGLLGGLLLQIRGTIGGTVGAVNALGMASIIKRITLRLNSGTVVWSVTGPNYHYLYRDFIDLYAVDVVAQSNARDAVTATAAVLDMVIPLQVNQGLPIGLLLLQNRQTTLTLSVEWEADVTVTATGTFTNFAVTPFLIVYSVPPNPLSLPTLQYVHQVVDESRVMSGAGDFIYDIPRANTYLLLAHGAGIGATGADSWTTARLRVNQTSYIFDHTPQSMDMMFYWTHGRARELGMVFFDFAGTSGLGKYGTGRDFYDSNRTTDFQSVIAVSGAVTVQTVREQLVDLNAA